MKIIAPSVLSLDYSNIKEEMQKVNDSKASWIHFDVMDGHFVPNITFGSDILKAIEKLTDKFIDVHVMVENPLKFLEYFASCKVDNYTFHYEAVKKDELVNTINFIKDKGIKVGISIKPNTEVTVLKDILPLVDLVLIMSVEPGFGNQKFLDSAVSKIEWLFDYRNNNNLNYLIEVDGGINQHTAKLCTKCDVLVSGSYLFKHPLGFVKGVETLL